MRILLVEDEEKISKLVKLNLEAEGHEVVANDTGKKALNSFASQHFDCIILDLMLPEISGLDVLKHIKLQSDIPVIIVSAKDTSEDRIQGLKLGADDYLTKPFVIEELLLRLDNITQRLRTEDYESIDQYSFGENTINFKTYKATTPNGEFILTNKETLLLKMLIERKEKVVSRNEILQTVWGYDVFPSTRTIDNFIMAFRKYFEINPKSPIYFKSIRGVGYKFTLG